MSRPLLVPTLLLAASFPAGAADESSPVYVAATRSGNARAPSYDDTMFGQKADPGTDAARPPIILGALSRDQLGDTIGPELPQLGACVAGPLAEVPGPMVVKFQVEQDGHVSSATVTRPSVATPDVEACITSTISTLKFPAASTITIASWPLLLTEPSST